jgi:hypothetical protein
LAWALVDAGAIEQHEFVELMKTPAMKAILKSSSRGAVRIREFACGPRLRGQTE